MRPSASFLSFLAVLTTALAFAPGAHASFHLFAIDQIYSNADGTVQFVVMYEASTSGGEQFWAGNSFKSTHAGTTKTYVFPNNLPSSATGGRRVLIATAGFAALGLVTPDYTIPNGFLATDGGTVNYAGVDQVTYASLPTDGVNAINRSGAVIPNLATNFAGNSASVKAAPPQTAITPALGLWENPNELGSGYAFDVKHGVLVITVYSYKTNGDAEWYITSGPLTDNGHSFTGSLKRYKSGQCISCPYVVPIPEDDGGIVTINFSSPTAATMSLPGGRVTNIQPSNF